MGENNMNTLIIKKGISFLKHYLISMFKKEEIILMLAKGNGTFSQTLFDLFISFVDIV